jgi:hypothetical protein
VRVAPYFGSGTLRGAHNHPVVPQKLRAFGQAGE